MFKHIHDLRQLNRAGKGPKRLVLAAAQDSYALKAVCDAWAEGLIQPILVGHKEEIRKLAANNQLNISEFEIIDESDANRAVGRSVALIREGGADILMKGSCGTAQLLKGVLNKEAGLRKGELLSHFALFEIPAYHKLLGITDVAINIAPTLQDKAAILRNAVEFLQALGYEQPKVAVIASVETVNEQMPATVDAALLTGMNRRNQITGCLVDGPLAFDNAISLESARHKHIGGEVAGDADLLLMPGIDAGNVLYKSLTFFGGAKVASIILGASAPVVLTSRSDSEDSKMNSILMAAVANIT
ncbi:MAG: bifunctional enoyl-CoA hydratase/phosphate acetyltransferase [Bacteroidales bacterium]